MIFSKCHLCQQEAELQESHIFPRSYFKKIKSGSGQVLEITIDKDTPPSLSNFDPKEHLLCFECEQHISKKYEAYGTQIFRKAQNIERENLHVKIKNFNYNKFYLFLISILWRASISTIERYRHINFDDKMNARFAACLLKESVRLSPSIKLDHFFRVAIFRLKDFSRQLDDDVIKRIFIDLNIVKTEDINDGITYFYVTDGCLVMIKLNCHDDIHQQRVIKIKNQMINKTILKIPFINIFDIKEVAETIAVSIEKLSPHPNGTK
ncbi:hypothetical protein [Aeromonas hydrophila]|uniref:hypothetical protein n=1 Tax=Aeromonas hydrophila TaxID=644 RepID=UPI0038D00F2B